MFFYRNLKCDPNIIFFDIIEVNELEQCKKVLDTSFMIEICQKVLLKGNKRQKIN